MREERKSDDLLLDAILLRALEEENKGLEREIRAANEAPTKEEDERLKALLKATWKKEQARQRRNRYLLRTAACFAVMLVVSFSVVMNVQAWRSNVVNYVLTMFDDYGTLSADRYPYDTERLHYLPTYIPEKMDNREIILDNENAFIVNFWGDESDSTITYQLFYEDASLIIDTEEAEIKTVFQDDQEITILVKGSERQILGIIPDTTYRYIITGTLSEEEMLKIAKSIKAEEEE